MTDKDNMQSETFILQCH